MNRAKPKKGLTKASGKRIAAQKTPQKQVKPLKTNNKFVPKRKVSKSHSVRQGKARPAALKPLPLPPRRPTPEEIAYRKAVAQFESGINLFNNNQFTKARSIFEHLLPGPARDLAQRAQVYVNICNQRLSRPSLQLKTADDFYNYAVSLANQGNHEESEQYLKKALKLTPKSDYIYYALATSHALRENAEAALENLEKAIQLNVRNRYLAQSDSDFANLGEDPRFTELIYPEKPLP